MQLVIVLYPYISLTYQRSSRPIEMYICICIYNNNLRATEMMHVCFSVYRIFFVECEGLRISSARRNKTECYKRRAGIEIKE